MNGFIKWIMPAILVLTMPAIREDGFSPRDSDGKLDSPSRVVTIPGFHGETQMTGFIKWINASR